MIEKFHNIFFIGIKGVAMSNLAVFLKKSGKQVTGADLEEEFITDKLLKANNIVYSTGFDAKILSRNIDLVVYSAAHGGLSNPLVLEAKKKGLTVMSQAALMGELMKPYEFRLAVSGCHGKTTTSSLLSYALSQLDQFPSYLVGVPFFSGMEGGHCGTDKYFVVEADEYGVNPPVDKTPKFHLLNPTHVICTNIDFDHPDVYDSIEETKQAFAKFFLGRKLVLCADDKQLMSVASKLKKSQYVTYGFGPESDYRITDWQVEEGISSFEIEGLGRFQIQLFGKMNISNAASVVVMLKILGFDAVQIAGAIEGFTGTERRFEKIYEKNNIYLFDDYAHHPSEIRATIEGAKLRFEGRRVIVIFQPHTFTRTLMLLNEFTKSLSLADYALILPIFASAREKEGREKVSSLDIIKGESQDRMKAFKDSDQLISDLKHVLQKGDIIFTMGAGDVYKLKDRIIKIIDEK